MIGHSTVFNMKDEKHPCWGLMHSLITNTEASSIPPPTRAYAYRGGGGGGGRGQCILEWGGLRIPTSEVELPVSLTLDLIHVKQLSVHKSIS